MFGASQNYAVGGSPRGVTIADIDADGDPDILLASLGEGVVVLRGESGAFEASRTLAALSNSPLRVQVADFDVDGVPDILAADTALQPVLLLGSLATGAWTEASRETLDMQGAAGAAGVTPFALALADFNADGFVDAAMAVICKCGSTRLALLVPCSRTHSKRRRACTARGSP